MNVMAKVLTFMSSQIKKSSVKLQPIEKPHTIRDDNQSIHNGVIHEKSDSSMRSEGSAIAKPKRGRKPKRDA